ncbi:MAG: hypothetical protein OXC31_29975 [Spirochaetaceae bacterium]|nr:hypothetical protein [Spirochaetaceae bacterium]
MRIRAGVARSAALRVAFAGGALILGAIACTGTAPRPAAGAGFVGGYGATAGRTAVNLQVTEHSFTAVTFTEPGPGVAAARADSARPASESGGAPGSEPARWVVFTGDVTVSGATVTVSVTGVERDGQALQGAELAAYATCTATATAGDAFAGEVIAALLDCLGATDPEVALYEYGEQERPSDLVLGTWDFAPDLSDPSRVGGSIVISSTELRVSSVASCQGEPFHDPGPFDPPDSPEPMLSVDPVAGGFEGEPLVFDVILSPTASGTVTVDWATADLTADEAEGVAGAAAAAGDDYTAGSGTLTFQAGQSSGALTVATIEDDAMEGNEEFKVELSNPGGALIAPSLMVGVRGSVGFGVIVDDDAPCPSLEVSYDASVDDTKIAVAFRAGRLVSPYSDPIELTRDNFGDHFVDISTGGPADLDYDVFYVIGATGDRAAFRVQHSEWSWVSRR